MPRHSRSHRKQILLFLIAVILPSLILVVFTLRMISQERELSQKRIADERGRLSSEIGQHLLVRLEKIKLQEIGSAADWSRYPARRDYVNPEVVLIGLVDQNRLLLPWDAEQRSGEYLKLLSRSDFAQKIQRAEKEEFVEKNFLQAAEIVPPGHKSRSGTGSAGVCTSFVGQNPNQVWKKEGSFSDLQ